MSSVCVTAVGGHFLPLLAILQLSDFLSRSAASSSSPSSVVLAKRQTEASQKYWSGSAGCYSSLHFIVWPVAPAGRATIPFPARGVMKRSRSFLLLRCFTVIPFKGGADTSLSLIKVIVLLCRSAPFEPSLWEYGGTRALMSTAVPHFSSLYFLVFIQMPICCHSCGR